MVAGVVLAGLYTNLYNTYVEGQVPGNHPVPRARSRSKVRVRLGLGLGLGAVHYGPS